MHSRVVSRSYSLPLSLIQHLIAAVSHLPGATTRYFQTFLLAVVVEIFTDVLALFNFTKRTSNFIFLRDVESFLINRLINDTCCLSFRDTGTMAMLKIRDVVTLKPG